MRPFTFLALFLLAGCSDVPPSPEELGLHLSVENVNCTDAWLRLKNSAGSLGRTIDIARDGASVQQIRFFSSDTLIVDSGLLPRRSYSYQLLRLQGGEAVEASPPVPLTTMDTTGNSFTWTLELLGDGNGSNLNDVAIINDTLAYAAGELYKQDSLGEFDPHAYNLVKWNGTTWSLLRVPFYSICGQSATGSYPTNSVLAFNDADLWVALKGGQVAHIIRDSLARVYCLPSSFAIRRIWGQYPNSMYVGGWGGSTDIAHFDGTSWQSIVSGTSLVIQDIWGAVDPANRTLVTLALASNALMLPSGKKLLRVNGLNVQSVPDSGLPLYLSTVWGYDRWGYLIGGDGIYYARSISAKTVWTGGSVVPVQSYTFAIRGDALNNIFAVGGYCDVIHYNGATWRNFRDQTYQLGGNFTGVAVKGDLVIAVGGNSVRGTVAIGRRNL